MVKEAISPKADAETLLDILMPFAENMLNAHREFFPFGAHMSVAGVVELAAGSNGTDHPPSQVVIDLLRDGYKLKAASGEIQACMTLYDSLVTPPNATEKQDAIAARVDHRDDYSVVVFFPYRFDDNSKLIVQEPFAVNRESDVFIVGRNSP